MIPETIKNFNVRENTPEFTLNDMTQNACAVVDVPNAPMSVTCKRVTKFDIEF